LGVSFEVVSYYYIFFAATGFIQHCNLNAKLGWFDYLIASGETHRFHHHPDRQQSKCNYANNLVLWDLIFQTFKKDDLNPITTVGMKGNHKELSIIEEIKYPLQKMLPILFKRLMDLSVTLRMKQIRLTYFRNFFHATEKPKVAQMNTLLQIIKSNRDTTFGKDHFFNNIHSIEDFKRNVPIRDYEKLRPYIEKIFSGETYTLTHSPPNYFTKTSGTTDRPKYIPVNDIVIKQYQVIQQILSYAVYTNDPRSFEGLLFTVVGSKEEEILCQKWAAGSMSGKLFSLTPHFLMQKHVFSKELGDLQDYDQKYLYLAALALIAPDVTFYASPNPSTLLRIFEIINSKKSDIITLLNDENDPILLKFIKNKLHAINLLDQKAPLTISDVWPNLASLVLWTGGNCSLLLPQIKKMIKPNVHLVELGYLCSEFYGTVTVDATKNLQVPTLSHNFFEFILKTNYENGIRETILLDELKLGLEYYIIVTTPGGLYRYFINDIVRVKDFFNLTPALEFLQKGKGITNLTGEKITENQLVSFFEKADLIYLNISFFMCLANAALQEYTLYIEAEVDVIDIKNLEKSLHEHLCRVNIEYESKVASKRLFPMKITMLKNKTGEAYRTFCLKKGMRESQYKCLYLQYSHDLEFPFSQYKK
jgi:hypothetical protein